MCEMSLIYGPILTGYFHFYMTVIVKYFDLWNVAVKSWAIHPGIHQLNSEPHT